MPEGDTVYQAAARIRRRFEGQVLRYSQFRVPRYALVDLTGRRVDAVRSIGKHLLIDVGDHAIHSHLKMEGAWMVHPLGTRWRRPGHQARIVLRTDGWEAVGFELGVCEWIPDPDTELSYLGPDLLDPAFDAAAAVTNLTRDPDRPIGTALLDQHLMAGVGNVYRCEACFLRGVRPARPVGEVDVPAMVDLCQRLLVANKDRTVRTTTGNTRRGQQSWVYGRGGRPCLRCRTPIERTFLGDDNSEDRVLYYCPRCQS
ncbi:Fpg/Nei family DNA glycosylase [Williamsia sterculiae]|uniref:DNA-(apurinic or apyrimidinic site) lyase n=1 Tax=Williamsia sterculiae TaxID=1344003 RepID=A0A1N7DYM5_9NOCA|nr:DNA-formamidopyrimidine glycosylase family protein [Williamsia sterculiae]SIR80924.1 endonuclease-8 [Williamsia sterculiae]